ncbi:MAG: DUF429 domain-containing protein [Chloroflexi bacterium]|nr:DUF429 domain-containing protein [Chloroflexota bacterium]
MAEVVGLDGCPDGWIAAVVADGRLAGFEFHQSARDALDAHPDAPVLAFDIPIGLAADGRRRADTAARGLLRGRASSVFNAPPRLVLDIASAAVGLKSRAEAYAEANEATRRVSGRGLSSQSFALALKIADVDRVAEDARVYEAHPEVTFAELAGSRLLPRKKTWDGLMQRRALLSAQGLAIPDVVGEVSGKAAADDIVDAVACAWTAARIAAGTARSLPYPPELIDGRAVAIWY